MTFVKGQPRPKNAGRRKGTPNKTTREIRERIQTVLEMCLANLNKDIAALEPKERLQMVRDLAEFVLPKLSRVEQQHSTAGMSPEQIDEMYNRIMQPND